MPGELGQTKAFHETERLWAMVKERYPFFADHEAKTERVIPVVVLERVRPVL
jgi:hypothetical protein